MWGVQHVEYWMTTDGRTFQTEEEANRWQEYLNSNESNANSYTVQRQNTEEDKEKIAKRITDYIQRAINDIKF